MLLELDLLKFYITRTATWRRGLSEKFPGDRRNLLAAEMLQGFARTPASEVDAEVWGKIEPFLASRMSRDAISTAARTVGFSQHPQNLNEFLQILLETFWDVMRDECLGIVRLDLALPRAEARS
jgi:hypothetical protein